MDFDYAKKQADYFECPRSEMLAFVPESARRILDVGCAAGTFAKALKRIRGAEVWGVEPDEKSAAEAANGLDRAICAPFDERVDIPSDYFDCVIFNDVLEHLLRPEDALEVASRVLRPGGVVVASIPNIRHFPTVWRLVMEGDWEYKERGILDATHVRFFTRASVARLFAGAGLKVEKLEGITPEYVMEPDDARIWRYFRYVRRLPSALAREMAYLQFAVVARAPAAGDRGVSALR